MIVCDRQYLRELEARMKAARKELPREVAKAIDREIEAIEAQGEPWYGTRVIQIAFKLVECPQSFSRATTGLKGFQGNLPKLGKFLIATWYAACAVNKSNRVYRTWADPDDAIRALTLAHRISRYEHRVHNA